MNRKETWLSIPVDLELEILSRLPIKSMARFRCVSKLWGSMLCSPYFTHLFQMRSSARPHLLFAVQLNNDFLFFTSSSDQRNHSSDKPSVVVSPTDRWQLEFCGYASGLICFRQIPSITYWVKEAVHIICCPSTGQHVKLPILTMDEKVSYSFLGFDPIDKQFKVLYMDNDYCKVLTLGTGELMWRKIDKPYGHGPKTSRGICINGVLYYLSFDRKIVSFDVRSEKFKLISARCFDGWCIFKLIDYKGKLCGICRRYHQYASTGPRRTLELLMCVLEDTEKQEWSEHVYPFPEDIIVDPFSIIIVGVTAAGEIVLSGDSTSKPFYVFYFNLERSTLQYVEIQSNHEAFKVNNNRVYVFVDHIEDDKFNTMVKKPYAAAASITPPEQKRKPTRTPTPSEAQLQQDTFESIDKLDDMCLLDDDETWLSFITPLA